MQKKKWLKGQINVMALAIGVIFLSFLVPLIYTAISPVTSTSSVGNESITMAASPVSVNLAQLNIVPGSETVYNATADLTIGEGFATGTECGGSGGAFICHYNLTDGNAYKYGTIVINKTGAFTVSYNYYPPGYGSSTDRSLIVFITTFLIIAVLVAIAKAGGLF